MHFKFIFLVIAFASTSLAVPADVREPEALDLRIEHSPCDGLQDMEAVCRITPREFEMIIDDSFEKTLRDIYEFLGRHENSDPANVIPQESPLIGSNMAAQGFVDDVKKYFTNYFENIKQILKGNFDEGIFNQLKNSGSWCESENIVVSTIKQGIDKITGGGISLICDCLYPLVKKSISFKDLVRNVNSPAFGDSMAKCPKLREAIEKILKSK